MAMQLKAHEKGKMHKQMITITITAEAAIITDQRTNNMEGNYSASKKDTNAV